MEEEKEKKLTEKELLEEESEDFLEEDPEDILEPEEEANEVDVEDMDDDE